MRVRRWLTVTCRQPRSGSHTRKTLHPRAAGTGSPPELHAQSDRQRRGDFPKQLAAGLVQAHLRAVGIIRAGGDRQHVLHPPDKLRVMLGRDAPALGQPRLEPVCFTACRTVSYEIVSTTASSTSRSASSRNVQRLWPSGGALHASATRRASCSPSRARWYWRAGGLRCSAASRPAATHCMRIRVTVVGWTSTATAIAASVQPGPASPWLAFSRIRAWVSTRAGATPCPIRVWSRARSPSDKTTMCRLRTSASCSGGIPYGTQHASEPLTTQVTADRLLVSIQHLPCVIHLAGHRPWHVIVPSAGADGSFANDHDRAAFISLLQQAAERTDLPFRGPSEAAYMAAARRCRTPPTSCWPSGTPSRRRASVAPPTSSTTLAGRAGGSP